MPPWSSIKTEYETTSLTLDELADKYEVSPVQVHYAAETENWTKIADLKALTKRAADKQTVNQSRYADLEAGLIDKIQSAINSLNPDDPLTPKQLKTLTDCVVDLRGDKTGNGPGSSGATVINVVSQFTGAPEPEYNDKGQVISVDNNYNKPKLLN